MIKNLLDYVCMIGESAFMRKKRFKFVDSFFQQMNDDGFKLGDKHLSHEGSRYIEFSNSEWDIWVRCDGKDVIVFNNQYEWRTKYPRFYIHQLGKYFEKNSNEMREKDYLKCIQCLHIHNKVYFLLEQVQKFN